MLTIPHPRSFTPRDTAMSRRPVLPHLFLFGVFACWGAPCFAGPIMGTISLSPVNVNGTFRTFDVQLNLEMESGWKMGYFSLDITASDDQLKNAVGGDYSAFSFTTANALGDWKRTPDDLPSPDTFGRSGRIEFETIDEPLELLAGSYKLGVLTLDLTKLTGTPATSARVAINAPAIGMETGTQVGGDYFGDDPQQSPFIILPALFPPDGSASRPINLAGGGGPNPSVVPEPSSLTAAVIGGLLFAAIRWRRRNTTLGDPAVTAAAAG